MDVVIQAIILGIVQGLTEFLPISSSAHLILIPPLLGWSTGPEDFIASANFDVMLHGGTLLALLIYFWRDVIRLIKAFFASIRERSLGVDRDRRLAWLLLISTIPAALLGIALESFFDTYFRDNLIYIPVLLVIGALLLYLAERKASHMREMDQISWLDALVIGIAQALALFPGISRSGVTIAGGLFLGMKREAAARFAFLMGIPVIGGAFVWKARELALGSLTSQETTALAAGFIAAAVFGVLAIGLLLRYLQGHSTNLFVAYRIGFAVIVAILLLMR
jgi:undecaprenyl-diphosphatase